MDAVSDELVECLAKTAQGDRQSFARLYRKSNPALYGLCISLMGNRDEAQDVLQDIYIQIWHHAGEYHADRGKPLTWMLAIGRYRCLDALRRRRHHSEFDSVREHFDSDMPGPLQNTTRDADKDRLMRCLHDLDERYRTSIEMAYFRGLSHQQLATTLGEPLGTAKSWVRRGLDVLRRCLHP